MAIATSTALALGLAAAGAGAQYYNTQRTERRQDAAQAEAIRNQAAKQRQADAKVNDQVAELEGSNSADERANRLDQYMETLRRGRPTLEAGFSPNIGSAAFREDSARAAGDVNSYANRSADLLARMDAPGLQRQGEAFNYGRLVTDLNLISREAQGQSYLDQLRARSIKRNPWIDLAAGLATAGSGALMNGAAGATGAASTVGAVPDQFIKYGGLGGLGY